MSITLMLLCRRSIHPSMLLRPTGSTSIFPRLEYATAQSKFPSLKPSGAPVSNPFRLPADEKSRQLKLQEQIYFREKHRLDPDMELVYIIPRYRLYGLMHLFCTCATVSMAVFLILYYYRDFLDIEAFNTNRNRELPDWAIYGVGSTICLMFGSFLVFIARMPTRLYYSSSRQSYGLFYYPMISVLRQRKIIFNQNQYRIVPQKLDSIERPERSIKINVALGKNLWSYKRDFYFVEAFFRSRKDLRIIQKQDIDQNEEKREPFSARATAGANEEGDIWETVVEKKDQTDPKQPSPKSFMR